jgi:glycosyltransferase involved in cell wall biosynthesis
MKIIFDHQIFSWQVYGGISRYFYEIANRIAATKGNDVEVFAPLYVNEYFRRRGGLRPRGLRIPPSPKYARAKYWINRIISESTLRPRKDVDILHETYFCQTDHCPFSAKRIVTVHDMIHEIFPDLFPQDDTSNIKALAIKRADHIICISENTQRDLINLLNVPKDKISVVHQGYSLTTEGAEEVVAVVGSPYILYVGNRKSYKNAERLFRVYAESSVLRNNFRLVFFGGEPLTESEYHMMKKLSLSADNVVHLTGGDGVLTDLYSGATAFVYPSLYEGFGIPTLEAMSLNCPVVCSNTSAIPEVVGDAAELFNPEDEGEMLKAIHNVVTSPARTADLIERGRVRCKQFSWDKCAIETLNVYTQVLQ